MRYFILLFAFCLLSAVAYLAVWRYARKYEQLREQNEKLKQERKGLYQIVTDMQKVSSGDRNSDFNAMLNLLHDYATASAEAEHTRPIKRGRNEPNKIR